MLPLFLNPALLGGVALVTVPIVLHLMMRQRPRTLEFPALRFVRKAQEQNRRTLQIRHWLLLLLRMAVIALLAAALARPSIQSSGWLGDRQAPVDAVLIFDTAPHMDYRHENQTRLEAARGISDWLLTQLPEESRAAIVDGDSPNAVFQVDLLAARQRIERLRASGTSRVLPQQLSLALDLLEKSEQRAEVYIFTDLAEASWSQSTSAEMTRLRERLPRVGLYVIDIGVKDPQDFGLGELRLSNQVLSQNGSLTIASDLQATGRGGAKTVELYVLDAKGQLDKRGVESVEMRDGESSPVEWVIGGLEPGTRQGVVKIAGRDGLAANDERFFTVDVRQAWPVLIVASAPVESRALYLTEALAPELFRKNGQARFECTVIGYAQLAAQPLDRFSGVMLLDPPAVATADWQRLATYALAGGGVFVSVGPQLDRESIHSAAAQELLPARLENIARFPEGDVHFSTDDTTHPLLSKFRALRGEVPWEGFPIFRGWRLAGLQPGCETVLRYNNGQAALVEKHLGQGRVLLLNTPLDFRQGERFDEQWNLLPSGNEPWPFVMFANELAMYLVGGSTESFNYLVGQPAVLRVDPQRRVSSYLLRVPGSDALPRNVAPQQTSIVESMTALAGNYQVEAGSESTGLRRGFSTNLPPSATRLRRIDPSMLDELLGKGRYQLAQTVDQIERELTTGRAGQELFPWIMAAMAIFLGCEQVLSNRFYREVK